MRILTRSSPVPARRDVVPVHQEEIQRFIRLQSSVFLTLQQDARTLIDGLANQADAALRRDRAEFLSELGTLREHTKDAVRQGNEKVDEMQTPKIRHALHVRYTDMHV